MTTKGEHPDGERLWRLALEQAADDAGQVPERAEPSPHYVHWRCELVVATDSWWRLALAVVGVASWLWLAWLAGHVFSTLLRGGL